MKRELTRQITLRAAFSGAEPAGLIRQLKSSGLLETGLPDRLSVDAAARQPTADWAEKWLPRCRLELFAQWGTVDFLSYDSDPIIKVARKDYRLEPLPFLELLSGLSFEVASFFDYYPEWHSRQKAKRYVAPSFADKHFSHGWGCAFKGRGHDRLVSRRWLDYGPWLALHDESDTTLILFHDLEADAAEALSQARPAHDTMGISDTGGYIESDYPFPDDYGGLYEPETRRLKHVIHGRKVTEAEMLDACAVRLYQPFGKDRIVENVAFVFMEEQPAREHLHQLWLRELECWAMVAGVERRLDLDYHPTPVKPKWALSLNRALEKSCG